MATPKTELLWNGLPIEKLTRNQLMEALKACDSKKILPSGMAISRVEEWPRPQLILLLRSLAYNQLLKRCEENEQKTISSTDYTDSTRTREQNNALAALRKVHFSSRLDNETHSTMGENVIYRGRVLKQMSDRELGIALTEIALKAMRLTTNLSVDNVEECFVKVPLVLYGQEIRRMNRKQLIEGMASVAKMLSL